MIIGQYVTHVATPTPQLYRYMDDKYVDEFLSSGKLRLGSFKKYRSEDHLEIGDQREGISQVQVFSGKYFSHEDIKILDNSYILCTSSILSSTIKDKFEANGGFVIGDINEFAADIAKNIPGCTQVLHGPCIYQNILTHFMPQFELSKRSEGLEFSNFINSQLQIYPYFHKFLEYADQHEYRIVFITDREAKTTLDIECKSAMKFCQKIPSHYINS